MKNLLLLSLCIISTGAFAQMQINKPVQLTGSGSDARIEGIEDVSANDHAANKIYVDTAIANRTGGGGGAEIRMFVTSGTWTGNLGGQAGADAKCQAEADAATLGGTWLAYISTTTMDAKDRIDNNTKIVNMLGETIAEYGLKIAHQTVGNTNLTYPVFYDATGAYNPSVEGVWTGTKSNGTANTSYVCTDWSTTAGNGLIGDLRGNNFSWNNWQGQSCSLLYKLYCFEQ